MWGLVGVVRTDIDVSIGGDETTNANHWVGTHMWWGCRCQCIGYTKDDQSRCRESCPPKFVGTQTSYTHHGSHHATIVCGTGNTRLFQGRHYELDEGTCRL
eukprot:scaffold150419_cov59-Attheya_sp.AAC.6